MKLPDCIFSQKDFDNIEHHIIHEIVMLTGSNYRITRSFIENIENIYQNNPNVVKLFFEKNNLNRRIVNIKGMNKNSRDEYDIEDMTIRSSYLEEEGLLLSQFGRVGSREGRTLIYERILQNMDTPMLNQLVDDIQNNTLKDVCYINESVDNYRGIIYINDPEQLHLYEDMQLEYENVMSKYSNLHFQNLILTISAMLDNSNYVSLNEKMDMHDASNRVLILQSQKETIPVPGQYLNIMIKNGQEYIFRKDHWFEDMDKFIEDVAGGENVEKLKDNFHTIEATNEKEWLSKKIKIHGNEKLSGHRI